MFKYTVNYFSFPWQPIIRRITVVGPCVTLYNSRAGKDPVLAKVFSAKGRVYNFLSLIPQDSALHDHLHDHLYDEFFDSGNHIHFKWPKNDNKGMADLPGLLDLIVQHQNVAQPLISPDQVALIKQQYELDLRTINRSKIIESLRVMKASFAEGNLTKLLEPSEGDTCNSVQGIDDLLGQLCVLLSRKIPITNKNINACLAELTEWIDDWVKEGQSPAANRLDFQRQFLVIKEQITALQQIKYDFSWYPKTPTMIRPFLFIADLIVALSTAIVSLPLKREFFTPISAYCNKQANQIVLPAPSKIRSRESEPLLQSQTRMPINSSERSDSFDLLAHLRSSPSANFPKQPQASLPEHASDLTYGLGSSS